ncbi:MAG TPA: hypothetical protein VGX02_01430 [Candidatus Eremiobacteraceae bacterium]|jgi:hypothetical protein|nr:hypothetical protein [Candidatus Eremiobacteraceae bacterium]
MLDATRGKAPNLNHLGALCHHLGVVQFAQGDTRDLSSGFCVDDNARALIVAVDVLAIDPRNAEAHRIGEAALALLERTQVPDGFHNLLDQAGAFIVEGGRSQDATGRAIWALGVTASRGTLAPWRERAEKLLARQWSTARQLTASRARAYAMLGAALMAARSQEARRTLEVLGRLLLAEFEAAATDDWPWWEPTLVWGNGRLPEAMLRAATALDDKAFGACGIRALEFLGEVTHERNVFVPIGNDGWYPRGGTRARHDQQPIEACAMVDAWLAAEEYTGDARYHARALEAFAWFVGANTERLVVADPQTGGCHDGIGVGRRNRNMGAESTLSYLAAHTAIARASH